MDVTRVSIGFSALLVFFFFAPFSVSRSFQYLLPGIPTSILVIALTGFLLALHLLRIRRLRSDRSLLVVSLLLLPMLASFVLLPVNIFVTGLDYSEYLKGELWGRMFNVFVYGLIFVAGWGVILDLPSKRRVWLLRSYLGALLIFVAVGLWQWASFYLGLPFPNLGTRTYFHSVPPAIRAIFPGRLTSLASEPSFLAPLMIDAMIIGAAVLGTTRRYIALVLAPAAWVLIFSFSGGGAFNVVALIAFALLLVLGEVVLRGSIRRSVLLVGVLATAAILALHGSLTWILTPIIARLGSAFDPAAHNRLYMVVMPFVWFAEDGWLSALLGHGPGSFTLLKQSHSLPDGGEIHVTSNNLFSDMLYESGALGLLLVVAFFGVLIVSGAIRWRKSREYLLGSLLAFHLVISSLYRADFVAPRFWVVVFSILILYRIAKDRQAGVRWRDTEERVLEPVQA